MLFSRSLELFIEFLYLSLHILDCILVALCLFLVSFVCLAQLGAKLSDLRLDSGSLHMFSFNVLV